ncbi:amidohydrolase family protein [Mucilaginibacter sp. L3T2-6]|nr:amidohydrolase family protein [Mucilaginibacter sp. L3T2-6]MDO3641114.1 amidohydrolase family protein [Mucilaginibacter sp. L3T2-6]MDV6213410.1 amidohydrolase family protein [Mucilaginibacter sp. L3T2-6]
MKKNKLLLKEGCIITMNQTLQVLRHTDILIENDKISAIAPELNIEDCQIIPAAGKIVMPGFVDSHRHVWESPLKGIAAEYSLMQYLQHILGPLAASYRPEDVFVANLYGALEALDAGITTIFDWSHIMNTPAHADAAITGLMAAGGRAVFGYGTPGTAVWDWFYESRLKHPGDIERICKEYFSSQRQLITPAMAIRGPEYSLFNVSRDDINLARSLCLPVSMHVGCGAFASKYKAIERLDSAGLLGPDMNFAHCNYLDSHDFEKLAANGCSISITPEVEMQMGIGFPATGKALAAGIAPALGIDVITATSGDMFTQMRIALQTQRAFANAEILNAGEMPQNVSLTTIDVLKMATINGARALNLAETTGSLEPGKQADIIMLDAGMLNLSPVNDPVATVVSQANISNIDTVIVAGKIVKANHKLLYQGFDGVKHRLENSAAHLLEQALVI